MVHTKDLMLGDYVLVRPSMMPIQIAAIHKKKVAYHATGDRLTWVRDGLIEPIPITPEILEKNGYIQILDDDGIHFRYTLIADGMCFSLKYALSVFQWLGPLDFKYVHELQHALRLCGIEKEIVL